MGLISTAVGYIAPLFLVTSPITSYGDQIRSIHVTHSSRGFSLDVPLIMLLASILRCFYWLGADFEKTLLVQSMLMIVVQLALLKVALDNRPASELTAPFSVAPTPRPYNFWQWRSQKPYWQFLAYFTIAVTAGQMLLGGRQGWIDALGYIGLGIEAFLPLPQVLKNQKARSCKGFRISVCASWIAGDIMKFAYFFGAASVGIQFKLCVAIQMVLDTSLGVQFWYFGNGDSAVEKEHEMT